MEKSIVQFISIVMNKAKKLARKYVESSKPIEDSVIVRVGDIISIGQDDKIKVIPRELANEASITSLQPYL